MFYFYPVFSNHNPIPINEMYRQVYLQHKKYITQ